MPRLRRPLPRVEALERRHLLTRLIDVDLDGDMDVVAELVWRENADGYGNFIDHPTEVSGEFEVGDIDGDSAIDIVQLDRWWSNFANPLSEPHPLPLPAGFAPDHLKLVDVSRDGDLDLILFNAHRAIQLENSDGRGEFVLVADIVLSDIRDVQDMDSDGWIDPITVDEGTIWLHKYRPNSLLELSEWATFDTSLGSVNIVSSDDLNLDGHNDLVWTQASQSPAYILERTTLNDATGRGREGWTAYICELDASCSSEYTDLDGDGDTDRLLFHDDRLMVDENIGERDMLTRLTYQSPFVLQTSTVGDLNGDGLLDLYLHDGQWYDLAQSQMHVTGTQRPNWPSDTRVFCTQEGISFFGSWMNTYADLNQNGTMDIVQRYRRNIEIFEAGQHRLTIQTSDSPVKLTAYDYDADGDQDLAMLVREVRDNGDRYVVNVVTNLGRDTFLIQRVVEVPFPIEWQAADMDGDGRDDLVFFAETPDVPNSFSIMVISIAENGVSLRTIASVNRRFNRWELADLNADGQIDILAAVTVPGDATTIADLVWFENEFEDFAQPEFLRKVPRYGLFDLVDINQDGKVDPFFSEQERPVWYNSAFSGEPRQIPTALNGRHELHDIDQDGWLDLVTVNENLVVWNRHLDGAGTFGQPQLIGYTSGPIDLIAGDLDGDRDIDVMTVNRDEPGITWFQRRVTGDSNDDGVFDSADLVRIFQLGQYEDGIYRNSTYESGDWNGDGEFTSSDFVFAMQAGTYGNPDPARIGTIIV